MVELVGGGSVINRATPSGYSRVYSEESWIITKEYSSVFTIEYTVSMQGLLK